MPEIRRPVLERNRSSSERHVLDSSLHVADLERVSGLEPPTFSLARIRREPNRLFVANGGGESADSGANRGAGARPVLCRTRRGDAGQDQRLICKPCGGLISNDNLTVASGQQGIKMQPDRK